MHDVNKGETIILIRYGEIALKGQNRGNFERRLVDNIRNSLPESAKPDIRRKSGRIYVHTPLDADEVLPNLKRVFGIVSMSPTVKVPLEDDKIQEAAVSIARRARGESQKDKFTFKIDARRANKSFHKTSPEINQWLGAQVLESVREISVDVHDPDLRLQVEIRDDAAYLMGRVIPAYGGLPVGSSGKAMILLSGGIDSPVAAWYMMRRGLKTEAIHFHTPPFTGPRAQKKVEDLASTLARYNNGMKLHLYHFTDEQSQIGQNCPQRLSLTVARRTMLRLAAEASKIRNASALVTGESLGQVASQTLENLTATDLTVDMPILRPLLGMDKQDIMHRAKDINTYDISIRPHEDCCTLFVPDNPKTRPSVDEVIEAEKQTELPMPDDLTDKLTTLTFDSLGNMKSWK